MLKDAKEGYAKDVEATDINLKKDQEIHFGDQKAGDEPVKSMNDTGDDVIAPIEKGPANLLGTKPKSK